jgi:Flp pilus assembly protein CpaB
MSAKRVLPAALRDVVGGPRRLLAAALAALAVVVGLDSLAPSTRSLTVWVAARDLAGGSPVTAADVAVRKVPVGLVPRGALRATAHILGRLVAAPMREGEPVTDVRLLEPPLLVALGQRGAVAVPVRVSDGAAAAALVHPGDVVDVLSAGSGDGGDARSVATLVAERVTVLSVPAGVDGNGGGLVVVAVTRAQAAALALAAAGSRISLALRHP